MVNNIFKKILIIGGSGVVGTNLIKKFKDLGEVFATYYTTKLDIEDTKFYKLDVRKKKDVEFLLQDIEPNVVINAAAKRNTRYCEKYPDKAYKVNVNGTRNIVNSCKKLGAKMIFFSSDQVFDGTKGKYNERDKTKPLNEYGKQKVISEDFIKNTLDDWLIIRASYIYGWFPGSDNFITWAIKELRKGCEIQVSYDQLVTPIHVEHFVDIVVRLLEKNKKGIYHVGEGDCLSKYKFVKRIKETFQFDKAIVKPISSEALDQYIIRPKKNCLDLSKIRAELDLGKYNIKKGLEMIKEEININRKN